MTNHGFRIVKPLERKVLAIGGIGPLLLLRDLDLALILLGDFIFSVLNDLLGEG